MSGVRARVEVFSLLNFKRLAESEANHADVVKDNRIMAYVTRGLETSDEEVIRASLSILELLLENPKNRLPLRSIAQLEPALHNLVERRFGVEAKVKLRAEKLIRYLEGTAKPVSKDKLTWPRKVLTFHVQGLHAGCRKELEDILTKKVKGVLTVVADVEHQRCMLSVYSHIEPKDIAEAIHESGHMTALQVLRNSRNQEVVVPLIEPYAAAAPCLATTSTPSTSSLPLPEYLDEEEGGSTDGKEVRRKDLRVTASEWFLTTAGFIQRSMYW